MKIQKKYSDNCFEHWLVMYFSHQKSIDEKSIFNQIESYIHFEGFDGFCSLKEELKLIKKNHDLTEFLTIAKQYSEFPVNESEFELMIKFILNYE